MGICVSFSFLTFKFNILVGWIQLDHTPAQTRGYTSKWPCSSADWCLCQCVWRERAFVRPPLSTVMISTPSTALHMSWWTDRPRTLGALWWSMCVRACVCACVAVVVMEVGVSAVLCRNLCVSLFSGYTTRPGHMAAIDYVINVHTHTEVILFCVLPDWIVKWRTLGGSLVFCQPLWPRRDWFLNKNGVELWRTHAVTVFLFA